VPASPGRACAWKKGLDKYRKQTKRERERERGGGDRLWNRLANSFRYACIAALDLLATLFPETSYFTATCTTLVTTPIMTPVPRTGDPCPRPSSRHFREGEIIITRTDAPQTRRPPLLSCRFTRRQLRRAFCREQTPIRISGVSVNTCSIFHRLVCVIPTSHRCEIAGSPWLGLQPSLARLLFISMCSVF
jgi:hypothetical protein